MINQKPHLKLIKPKEKDKTRKNAFFMRKYLELPEWKQKIVNDAIMKLSKAEE